MMARLKAKSRDTAAIFRAVEMYTQGKKVVEIAELFNVSQPTISYWVKEHGKKLFGSQFKSRSQGRHQDETPSDRDKDIILQVLMGMPCVRVAEQQKPELSRARISYIVNTWINRGYKPPMPFKPGDVIGDGGIAQYLVLSTNEDYKSGTVKQVVAWDENKKVARNIKDGPTIEEFRWYAGGQLCGIVNGKEHE